MLTPNALFVEQAQIVPAFVPVNLATAANPGDWVSMKNYARCTIIFLAGTGTASDDAVITLEQATAVAGTGNKALTFTRIDVKQGADLAAIGEFTTVTQTAATSYTSLTSAETQNLWVIDVKAEDLDTDNGYDCIQASIGDVGTNAKIGTVLYILWGARYAQPGSAIAD
jgi:hypothetical protein